MKYSCTTDIELGIAEVVKLWNDESFFSEWQDGFQSIELIEGVAGAKGAKSRLMYSHGKRNLELIETIIKNNLPAEKVALYEHVDMTNIQTSRFEALSEKQTRYTSEVEYTKFNGFMPNLMAKLFPGVFKKQSQKWMDQFKAFAENSK